MSRITIKKTDESSWEEPEEPHTENDSLVPLNKNKTFIFNAHKAMQMNWMEPPRMIKEFPTALYLFLFSSHLHGPENRKQILTRIKAKNK